MGAKSSKNSNSNTSNNNENTKSNINSELSSYIQACELDPDVKSFDSNLHEKTTHIINSIAADNSQDFDIPSITLDSLQQVTTCLIDMNQQVVRLILECKKDIWNNPELFGLVQDYFEYSVQTLDFFTALDECLKMARDKQLIIRVALAKFEEEMSMVNCGNVLEEFSKIKEGGDIFTDEFFNIFGRVYKQQVDLFEKLQGRKHKLDKKLKSVSVYRKVSNVIFAASFIVVIICSVVAAAISAPPLVSALAAAVSVPMGGIGKWMNSLWEKYETELKNQKELVRSMQVGTYIAIKDLDSIRVLVDKFVIQVEPLLANVEFGLADEGAMVLVMEEIKKKQAEFLETIDELGEHGVKYSRDIRRARTVILQRIIKHPNED